MKYDVLIVDDEKDIQEALSGLLSDEGYITRVAGNGADALTQFLEKRPHLVVLDVWLGDPKYDNLKLLEMIKKEDPDVPVLVISGHGTIETAVSAIKIGAYDFLEKPFNIDRLLLLARRAIESCDLKRENEELKTRFSYYGEILGTTAAMFALRGSVEKVASTNCRILITGPTGSGKELVARKIHAQSRRKNGPFVSVNCALLTPETLEKVLFGIEEKGPEKSTFPGVLEKADNGTLLLDEICDMPIAIQNKVVRILQDQVITRINSSKSFKVDVRVLASTAKDISAEILEGRFREDLFYRLSVIPLQVPPLREYRDDIPKLLSHYITRVSNKLGLPEKVISPDALAVLQNYEWPGNLKQLINLIEWLLIMSPAKDDVEITAQMLPKEIMKAASPLLSWDKSGEILKLPLKEARESFEVHYLEAQIHRFSGNISQTAQFIEMERSALHRKLKMLGIEGRIKS